MSSSLPPLPPPGPDLHDRGTRPRAPRRHPSATDPESFPLPPAPARNNSTPVAGYHGEWDALLVRTASPSSASPDQSRSRLPRPLDRHGTLFDPDKDDPVTFAASQRALPAATTPAASTSERRSAPSLSSSIRSEEMSRGVSRERRRSRRGPSTLTSATSAESGSAPLSAGDSARAKAAANSYIVDIKRTYRDIGSLEADLQAYHASAASEPISSLSNAVTSAVEQVGKHKRLAWLHVQFLELCLGPGSLASWRSLPTEQKMPVRMWQNAFHPLLEQLRHLALQQLKDQSKSSRKPERVPASFPLSSPAPSPSEWLLDHLADFVYFGYTLYSELVEHEQFRSLRTGFRESLGDLARYRMMLFGLEKQLGTRPDGQSVRNKPSRYDLGTRPPIPDEESEQDKASIGSEALGDWELDERQVWRSTAYEWYVLALSDVPGTGRLHHHLALLSRGDDLPTLYHISKALTASHPYAGARDALTSLFSSRAQQARLTQDSAAKFVWLHGALVTQTELGQFDTNLAQVFEWVTTQDVDQTTLMRMLTINLAAIFEFDTEQAVLAQAWDRKQEDSGQDESLPPNVEKAMRLACDLLCALLSHPEASDGTPSAYVTGMLTFLHTALSIPAVAVKVGRFVPWQALVDLSHTLPFGLPDPTLPGAEGKAARKAAALAAKTRGASKIGSSPPLPEDWAMRGMGWIGRKVYERGFWTPPPPPPPTAQARKLWKRTAWPAALRFGTEHDALHYIHVDVWDPTAEEEESASSHASTLSAVSAGSRVGSIVSFAPGLTVVELVEGLRWNRVGQLLVSLARFVSGLDVHDAHLVLVPPLTEQIARWIAPSSEPEVSTVSDEPEAIETSDDEASALKARQRLLRQILAANKVDRKGRRAQMSHSPPGPKVQKGYTALVLDTNVLLVGQQEQEADSWLARLTSQAWTVIVPLAVVTELDGLTRSHTPSTARGALLALEELEAALTRRTVKVQTSRFDFLKDLAKKSETINFDPVPSLSLPRARTLDDIVLRLAVQHAAHPPSHFPVTDAAPAVLVTFDTNLRLKARAYGIDAATPPELVG